MGLGHVWGTLQELMHPRGWHGRFVSKGKMEPGIARRVAAQLEAFSPRMFTSDAQSAQYLTNKAKPGRFGGGTLYTRLHADFAHAAEDLRDGKIDDPETAKFIRMMDQSSIELPDDLIMTRSLPLSAFGLDQATISDPEHGIDRLQGTLIADKAYGAATVGHRLQGAPPGGITMVIAAPKGTKAIIPGESASDRSLYLDRDQPLRVSKIEPDGRGGFNMYVVAEPRTSETPTAVHTGSHVGAGRLSRAERQANIQRMREGVAKQQGAGAPQSDAEVQAEADAREAARQQMLREVGQAQAPAASPAPAPAPASTPTRPESTVTPTPTAPTPEHPQSGQPSPVEPAAPAGPNTPEPRTEPTVSEAVGANTPRGAGGPATQEAPAPAAPAPAAPTPTPSPTPEAPPAAPELPQPPSGEPPTGAPPEVPTPETFRAAAADLQSPTAGPDRRAFNEAYLNLSNAAGSHGSRAGSPRDVARHLDSTIEANDKAIERMRGNNTPAHEIEQFQTNNDRLKALSDTIHHHYQLGGRKETAPAKATRAPRAAKAAEPGAPETPAAAKRAPRKKVPEFHERPTERTPEETTAMENAVLRRAASMKAPRPDSPAWEEHTRILAHAAEISHRRFGTDYPKWARDLNEGRKPRVKAPAAGGGELRGKALDDALKEAGLPRTGTANEKRARLASHRNAPAAPPAEVAKTETAVKKAAKKAAPAAAAPQAPAAPAKKAAKAVAKKAAPEAPATAAPEAEKPLRGQALDAALKDAGLPRTGTADEKRARLAEHHKSLAQGAGRTGGPFEGAGRVTKKAAKKAAAPEPTDMAAVADAARKAPNDDAVDRLLAGKTNAQLDEIARHLGFTNPGRNKADKQGAIREFVGPIGHGARGEAGRAEVRKLLPEAAGGPPAAKAAKAAVKKAATPAPAAPTPSPAREAAKAAKATKAAPTPTPQETVLPHRLDRKLATPKERRDFTAAWKAEGDKLVPPGSAGRQSLLEVRRDIDSGGSEPRKALEKLQNEIEFNDGDLRSLREEVSRLEGIPEAQRSDEDKRRLAEFPDHIRDLETRNQANQNAIDFVHRYFGEQPHATMEDLKATEKLPGLPAAQRKELADLRRQIEGTSPQELRDALRGMGVDAKGTTHDELFDEMLRHAATKEMERRLNAAAPELARQELERRAAVKAAKAVKVAKKAAAPAAPEAPAAPAKAAKKAATKAVKAAEPAAPTPVSAKEGQPHRLAVEDFVGADHGLDEGLRDIVNRELNNKKKPLPAIGTQLQKYLDQAGPGRQAQAMEITPEAERGPEWFARHESLLKQDQSLRSLVDRLKSTDRRKMAAGRTTTPPPLSAPEKKEAARVAEVAGVPESRVTARMQARKEAQAGAAAHHQATADLLRGSRSWQDVDKILNERASTVAEMRGVGRALGMPEEDLAVPKRALRAKVHDRLGSEHGQLNRDRQANIDRKRNLAETLAELDRMDFEGSSTRALTTRLQAQYNKAEAGTTERDEIGKLLAAVREGRMRDLPDLIKGIEQRNGLRKVGRTGERVRFHPAAHTPIGEPRQGQHIDTASPGYNLDLPGGETLPLFKPSGFAAGREPATPSVRSVLHERPPTPPEKIQSQFPTPKWAQLRELGSREDVRTAVQGRTKQELQDILDDGEVPYRKSDNKKALEDAIVQWSVGRRLDSDAITGRSSAAKAAKKAAPPATPEQQATATERLARPNKTAQKLAQQAEEARGLQTISRGTPAAERDASTPVKRANMDLQHGQIRGKPAAETLHRDNGDEALHLPNGGQDQGLLHLDSSIGTLWSDLASDPRLPNSQVNEVARIGEDVGRGKISLDEAATRLRALRDATGSGPSSIKERIDKTIGDIEGPPKQPLDLPEGTPAAVRDWLEKINDVPTLRRTGRVGGRDQRKSVIAEKLDLIRRLESGQDIPNFESELGSLPHESTDGAYPLLRSNPNLRSMEVRRWMRSLQAGGPPKPANPPAGAEVHSLKEARIHKRLGGMTITELRQEAVDRGIPGAADLRKNDLVEKLFDALMKEG